MKSGICKLCKAQAKLCKSHIIPRAFFKPVLEGGSTFWQVSIGGEVGVSKKAAQYWDWLLCVNCEKILKTYDDYALGFLKKEVWGKVPPQNDYLVVEGMDYKKLKLFQLSVLWRAGVTNHKMFRRMDLVDEEGSIRDLIIRADPGEPTQYPCFMSPVYWDEQSYRGPAHFVGQVEHTVFAGLNAYRLEFGACVWMFVLTNNLKISPFGGREFLPDPTGSVVFHTRNVRDMPYLREYLMKASTSGKLDGLA
jgi:hypothetical protein